MKKIAIISNSAFSTVNFRKRLIEDLTANGWTVYVLAPDFNNKYRNILEAAGAIPVDIRMVRTGMNPAGDLRSLYSLATTLKRISPDATFSYGIKPVIYGLIASRIASVSNRYAMIAGLGLLYVDQEPLSRRRKFLKWMANLMYTFSLRYAEKVFFQNFEDIDLFVGKNMIPGNKAVKLNGTGVDIDEFKPAMAERGTVTFILVSRLIKEKGIYDYVEAANRIKKNQPGVAFILLGDRDENPNSVELSDLKKWVAEGVIEWPGHVDDVRPWLRKSSVFVLPTYYREGIPKSILEAMAMGLPVITTDIPGCREAVIDGVNGILIPPKDIESLTKAMTCFITEPEQVQMMGAKSRLRAKEFFDVTEVNKKIIDIIEAQ